MSDHHHGRPHRFGEYIVVQIMGAAAAKHESFHAHAQRGSLRLDALPHKHTGSLFAFHLACLWTDLVTYIKHWKNVIRKWFQLFFLYLLNISQLPEVGFSKSCAETRTRRKTRPRPRRISMASLGKKRKKCH